jgi:hypothetical protein
MGGMEGAVFFPQEANAPINSNTHRKRVQCMSDKVRAGIRFRLLSEEGSGGMEIVTVTRSDILGNTLDSRSSGREIHCVVGGFY